MKKEEEKILKDDAKEAMEKAGNVPEEEKKEGEEEKEQEEKAQAAQEREKEAMKAISENMIDVAWNITVLDIETTLRAAISKIFRDRAVDDKGKKMRAKGLLSLSKIYKAFGSNSEQGVDDIKEMVKGQMNRPPQQTD